MGESPEQKELNLVGKVELRIALVESDSKLETILKTYLAPLLLKLASEHVKVRNKVSYSFGRDMESTWLGKISLFVARMSHTVFMIFGRS